MLKTEYAPSEYPPQPVCLYLANLKPPQIILWGYLTWYLSMVALYFDASPALWLSSCGIAALIGFALTLATQQANARADRWVIFRLYLFPFCVSSYSALIKGKGFFLLFPCNRLHLLTGITACASMVGVVYACKWIYLLRTTPGASANL